MVVDPGIVNAVRPNDAAAVEIRETAPAAPPGVTATSERLPDGVWVIRLVQADAFHSRPGAAVVPVAASVHGEAVRKPPEAKFDVAPAARSRRDRSPWLRSRPALKIAVKDCP